MVGSLSRESRAPAVVWVSETWKTHVFTTPLKFNNGTCLRWFFAFYQGKSPFFTTNFRRIGRVTFSKRLMAEIAKKPAVKNGWEPPENGVFGVQKIPNLENYHGFRWSIGETLGVYKTICWDTSMVVEPCWTPRVSGTTVAGWKQCLKMYV